MVCTKRIVVEEIGVTSNVNVVDFFIGFITVVVRGDVSDVVGALVTLGVVVLNVVGVLGDLVVVVNVVLRIVVGLIYLVVGLLVVALVVVAGAEVVVVVVEVVVEVLVEDVEVLVVEVVGGDVSMVVGVVATSFCVCGSATKVLETGVESSSKDRVSSEI